MTYDLWLVTYDSWLLAIFGVNLKQWRMSNNEISDLATSVLYCWRNTIKTQGQIGDFRKGGLYV